MTARRHTGGRWRGSRSRWLLGVLAVAALGGCAQEPRQQSALSPASPATRAVGEHWEVMLAIGVVVWVLVVGGLLMALFRRNQADPGEGRRGPLFVALAGAVVPAAVIIGVMAQSVLVLQQTDPGDVAEDAATAIEVEAHRYWWEVRYPGEEVVTANEIHIPTGERVRLSLTTDDVIHSLWVPQLSGKVDMSPGQVTTMVLEAEEPGTYWGQCAEYCGLQHAKMRFVVVAHERAEYEGWVQAQAQPATSVSPAATAVEGDPAEGDTDVQDDPVARGREVFMSSSCVYCHTIQGTEAQGELGPDLTHLASRQTLAAGTLENNTGNLAAWILDPQGLKEGNAMPGTDVAGDELQALLAYLESLE